MSEHCGQVGKNLYFGMQDHGFDFIGSQQDFFYV